MNISTFYHVHGTILCPQYSKSPFLYFQVLAKFPQLVALCQLKDGGSTDLELDKQKTVGVCIYKGVKYITFKRKGQYRAIMNLNMTEFECLTKCADRIRSAVDAINAPKTPVSPPASPERPTYIPRDITLYKWLYNCPVTGLLAKEAPRWYMNHRECRADGLAYDCCLDLSNYDKRPEMLVFDSLFTIPDNGTLAKKAYIYAIKHIVEQIRERDCEACLNNLPYRNPEHDLGCCEDFADSVEKFYQQNIMEQTDLDDMVVRIIRTINDQLPDEEQQGLLKEKLGKENWPSAEDVVNHADSLGQELYQVLHAAENISRPLFV